MLETSVIFDISFFLMFQKHAIPKSSKFYLCNIFPTLLHSITTTKIQIFGIFHIDHSEDLLNWCLLL